MPLPAKNNLPRLPFTALPAASSTSTSSSSSDRGYDTLTPFLALPWARRLISNPRITAVTPGSRRPKSPHTHPGYEDSLFAELLKGERGVGSLICLYEVPHESMPTREEVRRDERIESAVAEEEEPSEEFRRVEEVKLLVKLGDGMNGHRYILHGGVTATLLDEGMGVLQSLNKDLVYKRELGRIRKRKERERKRRKAGRDSPDQERDVVVDEEERLPQGMGAFTVELKVQYKKPVMTPGTILVTVKYMKRDGRKEWIWGEVRQWSGESGGEGEGDICAVGEALFVETRKKDKDPRERRSKL